jgi:hypothetical protein
VAPAPIDIPPSLREQIYRHARRCFPAECCGYLRGADAVDQIVECRNAHVDGEHPTIIAGRAPRLDRRQLDDRKRGYGQRQPDHEFAPVTEPRAVRGDDSLV